MQIVRDVLLSATVLALVSVSPAGAETTPLPATPAQTQAHRSPAAFSETLAKLPATPSRGDLDALDRAAGQQDAIESRLYWHTDLSAAQDEARRTGRPILSLRLLGRLDEELSCANSRFFRKMLYPDPAINKLLQERFVLHWESLRPVPVITIDFGDGRVVKRTITGNSIHYLLGADGTVMDAIPGLVDAVSFERELRGFAELTREGGLATRAAMLAYHADVAHRRSEPVRLKTATPESIQSQSANFTLPAKTKTGVEFGSLRGLRNPSAFVMADTRQNLGEFRPKILRWLAAGEGEDLRKLNSRIYRELFQAALEDPNMGLNPPDESALFAP